MDTLYYKDITGPTYYRTPTGNYGYIGYVARNGSGPVIVQYATYYSNLHKWDEDFTTVTRHEDDVFGHAIQVREDELGKEGIPICPLAPRPVRSIMVLRTEGRNAFTMMIRECDKLPTDVDCTDEIFGRLS